MKSKKLKWIAVVGAVAMALAIITVSVMAYFSTLVFVYTSDGEKKVFRAGMRLSLLFDKLDASLEGSPLPFVDPTNSNAQYEFDPDEKWGTAQNPYIISDIRHLQNLSALQDIGYFYNLNIKNNFNADGTYPAKKTENGTEVTIDNDKPYFLVCTKEGKPVTIDGTDIKIKPIGTEQFPFIGEIGGAFVNGTTSLTVNKGTSTNKNMQTLQSDTSAIFNITVMSKRKMPDHGLFGYVSYLGQDPSEWTTGKTTFTGYVSKISDLLMADVSLVVRDENFIDTVANWMSTHIFSYSTFLKDGETLATLKTKMACETHHIGILAGHVNYVDVKDISIYYSSDEIVCIDLNDKQSVVGTGEPDDSAATGDFNNNYFSSTGIVGYIYSMNPQYTGNQISIGTGSSSASVGSLGGGGSASGVNPGYVLASNMYNLYSKYSKPPELTKDKLPTYETSEDIGIMIYVSLDANNNPIFMDEIGRQLYPVVADNNGFYKSGGWQYMQEGEEDPIKLADTPFFYCQEEINNFDSDGNFDSKTYYYTELTYVDSYKIKNKETEVEYTFTKAFGTPMTVAFGMKYGSSNTNMYLYSAKLDDKNPATPLCTQWYRDRLLLGYFGIQEATGRYYFYDGVFTFALSNTRDVIREIWPKAGDINTIPSILLAEEWTVGKMENAYTWRVSFVPATTTSADKVYVLAYKSGDDYYIMNMNSSTDDEDNGLLAAESLNSILTTKKKTKVTNGSGFYVDAGMYAKDAELFDKYFFTYDGKGTIKSDDAENIYLGVHSHAGLDFNDSILFWNWDMENYEYAFSGEKKSTVPGAEIAGTVSSYEDYSYTANLTKSTNSNLWTVTFTNVMRRTFSFSNGKWSESTVTRYLTYNSSSNTYNASNSASYDFYLFEVVKSPEKISSDNASNAMKPVQNANNVSVLANQYVLWPQLTTSGDATLTDTTYSLFNVGDLGYKVKEDGTGSGTWRYATGSYLYQISDALKYTFSLVEGAKYGTVNAGTLGGDYDGGNAFVKATLGSNGSQAFIPMGCISFEVNKKPAQGDPIKIRVIVAVPTSSTVEGLSYNEDYYFGLWRNELVSNNSQTITFAKTGTIEKFELPRSQPLFDGTTLEDETGFENPIQVQYDANRNGVIDDIEKYNDLDGDGEISDSEKNAENLKYRYTYFQGETVLVAYEFNVTEAGLYTLGAINGPMEIVYFSADGVASMGRDGTGGAQLEGVDFVYDNYGYVDTASDKIVTVTTTPPENQDVENYNYYYESGCLMYFDNETRHNTQFVDIYHEKIYIRRYINTGLSSVQKTELSMSVTQATELSTLATNRYVKLEYYASKHDNTVYRPDDIYKKQSASTS